MQVSPLRTLPLLVFLLAGCGLAGGNFPSLKPRPGETPRVIMAPGEGVEPGLSREERAGLLADIERETNALETVRRDMEAAERELASVLAAATGLRAGAEAWSAAQMALSRYDLARSPLVDIDARMTPLLRIVDSLPADNPDRQAVESLAAAVARAGADGEQRMQAASRALEK